MAAPPALVTKDFARTTLRARHRPMVRAIGEALFSPDGEAPPAKIEAFVDDFDGFISPTSVTLRYGLLAMMFVLKWSPIFFGKLRTFDELSVDERVHHLERLDQSKVKQFPLIVAAFKTVMTMVYYEDEEELTALGYPGPERTRYLNLGVSPTLAKKTKTDTTSAPKAGVEMSET